ncbi:MAG: hypothetical protein AB7H97_15195 [Pseudobdellovibrionaceae bacterium]
MNIFLTIFLFLPNWAQAGLPALLADDNSPNIYTCSVFEPSSSGGAFTNYRLTPDDQVAFHQLQDGVHYLEIHWRHWILNLSIHKNGVIPEILGGA